jgi:hypothetical protein
MPTAPPYLFKEHREEKKGEKILVPVRFPWSRPRERGHGQGARTVASSLHTVGAIVCDRRLKKAGVPIEDGQRFALHIHLDPEAVRFFQEVCANRDLGETMFLPESGEPWVQDSQKKPMRRACTVAQIKRFGFHQLRHSAASRWITLGVSLNWGMLTPKW